MRDLYLMFFTQAGESTASRIADELSADPDWTVHANRIESLRDFIAPIFKRENILIFIGAAGIAVRGIAPHLCSKTTDPPVLVIDEPGRYVIPILSGHLGGANRLAERIADRIGAVPVITTATDLHRIFAVDLFASENGYSIQNPEMIKVVSSRLLENLPVGLSTELEIIGPLPANLHRQDPGTVGIYIGLDADENPFDKTLHLIPKCHHLGIGTKRGIDFNSLHRFFLDALQSLSVPVESIGSLSSIDLKKDEKAINALAARYGIPFRTYTKSELLGFEQEFDASEFVRDKIGVGNVCEISAWLSSGKGKIILKKTIRSGMTLAVAEEPWTIRFEPERCRSKESVE